MKNRPTCQICCVYHALFRPFVRYAVNSMQKSYFLRFSGFDLPGCLLGVSGCLLVSPGCLLDLLGVSWESPGCLLVSPECLLGISWMSPGASCVSPGCLLVILLPDASQVPPRCVSDASQMLPTSRCVSADASQMPPSFSDASHIPSPQ